MPIFKNLFNNIKKAIRNIIHRERPYLDDEIEKIRKDVSDKMLDALERHAPDGSRNLDQFDGFWYKGKRRLPSRKGQRPSVDRMKLIPIKESFRKGTGNLQLIGTFSTQGDVRIYTVSEHATYFTRGIPHMYDGGTRPHRVPRRGFMKQRGHPLGFFWQGQDHAVWTWTRPQGIKLEKHGDYVADAWAEVEGTEYVSPQDLMNDIKSWWDESLGE